jgi:hypothetical protein
MTVTEPASNPAVIGLSVKYQVHTRGSGGNDTPGGGVLDTVLPTAELTAAFVSRSHAGLLARAVAVVVAVIPRWEVDDVDAVVD